MDAMKELYEKVANDSALQTKFNAIISDAEQAGEAATGDKLIAFAKEAGYEVSLDEMGAFFKKLTEKSKEQLSDAELDMVAGGKSALGGAMIFVSVTSIGMGCLMASVGAAEVSNGGKDFGVCSKVFD
jgi:predicted ribosomally synthesized peptide with nif11-like leader